MPQLRKPARATMVPVFSAPTEPQAPGGAHRRMEAVAWRQLTKTQTTDLVNTCRRSVFIRLDGLTSQINYSGCAERRQLGRMPLRTSNILFGFPLAAAGASGSPACVRVCVCTIG